MTARRAILVVAGAVALAGIGVAAGGIAIAQAPLDTQRARLVAANHAADAARKRAAALARAASRERDAAVRSRAETGALAARVAAAEADIAAARARVAIVQARYEAKRSRLIAAQGPITRLVAALQMMVRRPPLAGLVQPGTTRDMAHVRAVLATITPMVRERTADLRADVAGVAKLRGQSGLAVASLRDGRARLDRERLAQVTLEAQHRLASHRLERGALVESDRAIALGERARDIVDLMETIDDANATRDMLTALPGPLPRPTMTMAAAPAAGGHAPYILPVTGQVVTGFGAVSDNGVRSRGVTLSPWPGAQVVAPATGRVVYSGRFRNYGTIVILDHGKGWTTLITGLSDAQVRRGDQRVQGQIVGHAGQGDDPRVTVELRRRGQPIDLTALLG